MRPEDIAEGRCYTDGSGDFYWRRVEMIVDSPSRPGGRAVRWSTDGFCVVGGGRRTGLCGIETFARWARAALPTAA